MHAPASLVIIELVYLLKIVSLNDVWKWEVTYFHEYWQVMNWEQRIAKHGIHKLNCGGGLKADEN